MSSVQEVMSVTVTDEIQGGVWDIESVVVLGDTVVSESWLVGPPGPPGPSGEDGAPGGGTQQSVWNWHANPVTAPLPSARVGVDNDAPASATHLWINKVGKTNGIDWSLAIGALTAGDHVYAQAKADATSWHRWVVTGTPVVNGTNWVIPIVTDSGSPQGTEPAGGADVLVAFQYLGAAGVDEVVTFETGHEPSLGGVADGTLWVEWA